MPTTFIRVRDRETGAEYDVADVAFNPDVHVKVNSPKMWPDLTGDRVSGRLATYPTATAADLPENLA